MSLNGMNWMGGLQSGAQDLAMRSPNQPTTMAQQPWFLGKNHPRWFQNKFGRAPVAPGANPMLGRALSSQANQASQANNKMY